MKYTIYEKIALLILTKHTPTKKLSGLLNLNLNWVLTFSRIKQCLSNKKY